jgi:hypothetical protein
MATYEPSQCVPVGANVAYMFGGMFYTSPANAGYCVVRYYHVANCTAGYEDVDYGKTVGPQDNDSLSGWQAYMDEAPSGPSSVSAFIYCGSEDVPVYVDKLYLNPYGAF